MTIKNCTQLSMFMYVDLWLFTIYYYSIKFQIGQVIYRKLEKMEQIKLQNEQEFLKNNGVEAFKAVKALGQTFV